MERIDLVSVALMWCVGISALIQAVNARGHFRIAISWILSAAIIAMAVFFSSLKAIDLRNLFSTDGPVSALQASAPPPPGPHPPRSPVDQDSLASSYLKSVERLLKDAKTCAQSVQAFDVGGNLSTLSSSRFEKEESRARALRNESSNLHRQLRSLRAPAPWQDYHSDLLATLENLRLAGYEIHAQFSADEDLTSPDLRNQAQRHAQQAMRGLEDASKRFDGLEL